MEYLEELQRDMAETLGPSLAASVVEAMREEGITTKEDIQKRSALARSREESDPAFRLSTENGAAVLRAHGLIHDVLVDAADHYKADAKLGMLLMTAGAALAEAISRMRHIHRGRFEIDERVN